MFLPFSYDGSFEVPTPRDAERYAEAYFQTVVSNLQQVGAKEIFDDGHHLTFEGSAFRWGLLNFLAPISKGEVTLKATGEKLVAEWKLTYTALTVVLAVAAVFFSIVSREVFPILICISIYVVNLFTSYIAFRNCFRESPEDLLANPRLNPTVNAERESNAIPPKGKARRAGAQNI